jgi:hypothetical protein
MKYNAQLLQQCSRYDFFATAGNGSEVGSIFLGHESGKALITGKREMEEICQSKVEQRDQ